MKPFLLTFLLLIILSFSLSALPVQNPSIIHVYTNPDSLNFFWQKYIKNAVYELNPSSGFNDVSEIPVNNVVRYCLNEYYRTNGFNSLQKQQSIVPFYYIHVSDLISICNDHLNIKTLYVENLEEAVFNIKSLMIAFDPRILSFYHNDYPLANFTELEKITVYNQNLYEFKVNFFQNENKSVFINSILYQMKKRDNGSFYFLKSIYQMNPQYYKVLSSDFKPLVFNLDPLFINDLTYIGAEKNTLFFCVRDFLSGIFNIYSVDKFTMDTSQFKRIYLGKKLGYASVAYSNKMFSFSFSDETIYLDQNFKQINPKVANNRNENTQEFIFNNIKNSDHNKYGDFYLYSLADINNEFNNAPFNHTPVWGTWYKKLSDDYYSRLEIPSLLDNPYENFESVALGKDYTFYLSYIWSETLQKKLYSLNRIDLANYSLDKNLKISENDFPNLLATSDKQTVIMQRVNYQGYKFFYILNTD